MAAPRGLGSLPLIMLKTLATQSLSSTVMTGKADLWRSAKIVSPALDLALDLVVDSEAVADLVEVGMVEAVVMGGDMDVVVMAATLAEEEWVVDMRAVQPLFPPIPSPILLRLAVNVARPFMSAM